MPLARIYLPTKNAMQSGGAKDEWLLEFVPETPYFTDNLMGWTGMEGTVREIRMQFPSSEAAIAYAKKHGISYDLELPNPTGQVKKAYADNFGFKKIKA
ncbi:MAG: ETC complex I subunit [Alphaproteobacteria bacterium]|nr:ETC complex I subunit [Alphaproteobacteria bacterium]